MHPHPVALLVMLPLPEPVQHLQRVRLSGREQRMPAILLGARDYLPADDRTHPILLSLILERGARLRQANLLGWRSHTNARLLITDKQAAGQLLPGPGPVGIAAGPQRHGQLRRLPSQVPQGADISIRFACSRVEQGMQAPRPAPLEYPLDQGPRQVTQLDMPGGPFDAQKPVAFRLVAVEEFLAVHVLVAGGDVALAQGELAGPAWDGVLVEADQGVPVADQVPGVSAAAEGIDLVPGQVTPPAADEVPRRAGEPAGEQGEASVLHLVEVEDASHADHQGEHAGQQSATQRAVLVRETPLGRGEPAEGGGQQEEGAGVLSGREKNWRGGGGTGSRTAADPATAAGSGWAEATVAGAAADGRPGAASPGWPAAASGPAWSRPYFLRNLCRACRLTRTLQVRWMKSSRSQRLARGHCRRNWAMGPAKRGKSLPWARPARR